MSSRVARVLRSPIGWLLLLAPLVFLRLDGNGRLKPVETNDTVSYEVLLYSESLSDALSAVRTYGYPAFLHLYRWLADDSLLMPYADLPEFQLAFFWVALLFFASALRTYLGSALRALIGTLPLCVACLLEMVGVVQSDFAASVFAVMTFSFLLLLAVHPRNPLVWSGLALTLFATYQVRPAYVFLLVLVPVLGLLLRPLHSPLQLPQLKSWFGGLIAVAILPYLAFCGLRWSSVGEFALVNFGGYNMIGVTSSFLDDDLVSELPARHQQLAAEILAGREAMDWRPLTLISRTQEWFQQQSPNVWLIAEPAARERLLRERESAADREVVEFWSSTRLETAVPPLSGAIALAINQELSALSMSIIRRRPLLFLKWSYDGFVFGLGKLFECFPIRTLGALTLLTIAWALLARRKRRGRRLGRPDSASLFRLLGIAILAGGLFLGKLSLVAVTNYPRERFLDAAHILVPTVLALVLFELWRFLLSSTKALEEMDAMGAKD